MEDVGVEELPLPQGVPLGAGHARLVTDLVPIGADGGDDVYDDRVGFRRAEQEVWCDLTAEPQLAGAAPVATDADGLTRD